ncbi:hypothetical protein J6590_057378 [Homalodisca vitripennis]|nr:hypothetical protein J6590_057378 [Homalodisca vitripennis]
MVFDSKDIPVSSPVLVYIPALNQRPPNIEKIRVSNLIYLEPVINYLGVPMAERSKSLDFESELEIAQARILSVTLALFISTIDLVLYRLSPLLCFIRFSHRPVAHEDGDRIRLKRRLASPFMKKNSKNF